MQDDLSKGVVVIPGTLDAVYYLGAGHGNEDLSGSGRRGEVDGRRVDCPAAAGSMGSGVRLGLPDVISSLEQRTVEPINHEPL